MRRILSVKNLDGSCRAPVHIHFEEEQTKTLERFTTYAKDIESLRLDRRAYGAALSIKKLSQTQFEFRVRLPSWSRINVFMHKLRPLILKNESTEALRVISLLYKSIPDEITSKFLNRQRNIFLLKELGDGLQIKVRDYLFLSEEFINDWMNAYEYHRDLSRQIRLSKLMKAVPDTLQRLIVVWALAEKARSVAQTATFVRSLLAGANGSLQTEGDSSLISKIVKKKD